MSYAIILPQVRQLIFVLHQHQFCRNDLYNDQQIEVFVRLFIVEHNISIIRAGLDLLLSLGYHVPNMKEESSYGVLGEFLRLPHLEGDVEFGEFLRFPGLEDLEVENEVNKNNYNDF